MKRTLIVPVIFLFVFLVQIYQQWTIGLSPWKGGGMGMFSNIQSPETRIVKVYIVDATGQHHPVTSFRRNERRVLEKIKSAPKGEFDIALAKQLFASTWSKSRWLVETQMLTEGGSITDPQKYRTIRRKSHHDRYFNFESLAITSVEIEVSQIEFDNTSGRIFSTPLVRKSYDFLEHEDAR